MSYTKFFFNKIWLMEVLKIYQEEQLQMNYYVAKHLILQEIANVMDIKEVLASMVYKSFDKKTSSGAIKNKNMLNE